MIGNPVEKLVDMAAVHAFYISILEHVLGHEIPVPHEVSPAGSQSEKVTQSINSLENWLSLLDLAITPPMVRDGLKETTTRETAEALLRYYVHKSSRSDSDRDKTDFAVTFLYRMLVPQEKQGTLQTDPDTPSTFEEEIYEVLGEDTVSPIPEEHRQLVREFPFIRTEVDEFSHFDQLMDSGIMGRVRDIKHRFGPSFYHPRVLATSAEYNVFFGNHFDLLFRQTADQIKKFASSVRQQGGSTAAKVDGDITVKHLEEVEGKEEEILTTEYGRAQEHFRNISKMKKAVDNRSFGRPAAIAAAAATGAQPAVKTGAISTRGFVPAVAATPKLDITIEEGKIKTMHDTIRNFVLAADPKSANVVPLRNGNLALSQAEVDSFRVEYSNEKSFRADYAWGLRQAVTLQARLWMELQEYQSKIGSAYLWKPHADSLAYLLTNAQRLEEKSAEVIAVANQRGLTEKVAAMGSSLQKLRAQVEQAAKALQTAGVR